MTGLLAGKSALVTGGASGIGRAAALAFAREGARVLVADLAMDGARETVGRVNAAGGQAVAFAADMADPSQVEAMVAAAVSAFGRLDCAFNNAGIAPGAVGTPGLRIADVAPEAWDRLIAVNLTGVWHCLRHEVARMLAQGGGGAIVNTASIASLVGLPGSGSYVASKHGVLGLTRAAALDYAADGIRVNAVCPGYVGTPMTEETMRRRGAEVLAKVPLNRLGTPEEIAEAVVWLCSDRAGFVTGAAHTVDGGYTAA
jgi:NAD(P)-dependent dehydrogenase (short-subunit alcohol dehydrogenase family)